MKTQRFLMLPTRGLVTTAETSLKALSFMNQMLENVFAGKSFKIKTHDKKTAEINVVDSVHENGVKLVEVLPEDVASIRMANPGFRIVPEVFYKIAKAPMFVVQKRPKAAAVATKCSITLTGKTDGDAIAGAFVVAFTNFAQRLGDSGTTNSKGKITLRFSVGTKIERLYIYPKHSYWTLLKKSFKLKLENPLTLEEIDFAANDALREAFPTKNLSPITNPVRIGVIDTGSGQHPHLAISGGENTVSGEDPTDFYDNGEAHGTHVAGIIGANPPAGEGLKGVAVGAEIRSYRVFGKGEEGASNFAIIKAIDRAVADGCDLINMSLGGGPADEATQDAIQDAYSKGVLCFVATGNDGRQPVSFPASFSLSIAVGAYGIKNTYPASSTQVGEEEAPFGKNKDNYVAAFSNIGVEVDMIAPGVGIVSTVPDDAYYAAMDGTSMACPAACGIAARLLDSRPDLLALPRTQQRSDEFINFLNEKLQSLGFGALYEGRGTLVK